MQLFHDTRLEDYGSLGPKGRRLPIKDDNQQSDETLKNLQPADRRQYPRKPCFIAVTCVTSGHLFADYVRNMSAGGVFIETSAPCFPGDDLTMMFSFPYQGESVKTSGKIMWKGPAGVGVQFTAPSQDLQTMAASHWSVRINSCF